MMSEMYKINDISGQSGEVVDHAGQFLPYAHKRLGFNKPVGVNFISDPENAKNPLGKTGYYDPNKMEITIFVDKRHVKDILRSLSHELVHHTQNCRGEFEKGVNTGPGYAQKDPHMRKMEAEAYLLGNGFLFRDWEDHLKLKESKTMAKSKINEKHDCAVHEGEPHAQWEAKQLGKAGVGPHAVLEEDDELTEAPDEAAFKYEELPRNLQKLADKLGIKGPFLVPVGDGTRKSQLRVLFSALVGKVRKMKKYRAREAEAGAEEPGAKERMLKKQPWLKDIEKLGPLEKGPEPPEIQVDPEDLKNKPKKKPFVGEPAKSKYPLAPGYKELRKEDLSSVEKEVDKDIDGDGYIGKPPKKEKNENWARGNKDELLFERLVKKWAK